jgi:hypothetical protein
MPELMKGLGVKLPGHLAQHWQQFERRGMHELQYGSTTRKVRAVTRPILAAALFVASVLAVRAAARRL